MRIFLLQKAKKILGAARESVRIQPRLRSANNWSEMRLLRQEMRNSSLTRTRRNYSVFRLERRNSGNCTTLHPSPQCAGPTSTIQPSLYFVVTLFRAQSLRHLGQASSTSVSKTCRVASHCGSPIRGTGRSTRKAKLPLRYWRCGMPSIWVLSYFPDQRKADIVREQTLPVVARALRQGRARNFRGKTSRKLRKWTCGNVR